MRTVKRTQGMPIRAKYITRDIRKKTVRVFSHEPWRETTDSDSDFVAGYDDFLGHEILWTRQIPKPGEVCRLKP